MDILSVLQTNFLSLVLGVIVFVLLWMNRGKKSSFERLPPGPPPSPIVGNLFQIDLAEPYKYYLEVRVHILSNSIERFLSFSTSFFQQSSEKNTLIVPLLYPQPQRPCLL